MMFFMIVFLLLGAGISQDIAAQPYRPNREADILETLPVQSQDGTKLTALRQQVAANPGDLPAALALVRQAIELGRAQSDPRYYGYAEAGLKPWLNVEQPAAEVLTLQATLYQNRHQFPQALQLLERALRQQPRLAQAWLTRAQIQEVQGRYADAFTSCLPLRRLASPLVSAVCLNSVLSLSGHLEDGYRQLQDTLRFMGPANPVDRQWAFTTLAEMAERKGDSQRAGHYYRLAFNSAGRNGYLIATYADFLLDQKRFDEAVDLLKYEIRHDGLLLRLSLAERQLRLAGVTEHIAMLSARFAAARMRGDTSHQGEEARYRLELTGETRQALDLAVKNWSVQREPRDARILLEAALANGNGLAAAQPVMNFIAQTHVQDIRLQPLLRQLQEIRL